MSSNQLKYEIIIGEKSSLLKELKFYPKRRVWEIVQYCVIHDKDSQKFSDEFYDFIDKHFKIVKNK